MRICQFRQHLYQRFFSLSLSLTIREIVCLPFLTMDITSLQTILLYPNSSTILSSSLSSILTALFTSSPSSEKKLAHAHKLRGNKVLVHFQFSSRVISHVIRQSSLIAGREQRRQLYTLGRYDNRQVLNSNFFPK